MAGEVNMTTLVIAPLIGVASALLTIVLSPTLQHYFWRRQRRAERQLAVIDELNTIIAQLLHRCHVDYETAAAEHRAPEGDPEDSVWLSLAMLYAPLEALFSPSARKAVKELREQLIALGDTIPDQSWLQAVDGVAQAHVNALRALYEEVGIASFSWERMLAANGLESDGALLHTKIHTRKISSPGPGRDR